MPRSLEPTRLVARRIARKSLRFWTSDSAFNPRKKDVDQVDVDVVVTVVVAVVVAVEDVAREDAAREDVAKADVGAVEDVPST